MPATGPIAICSAHGDAAWGAESRSNGGVRQRFGCRRVPCRWMRPRTAAPRSHRGVGPGGRVSGMQSKLHGWAAADPGRRFDDLFNLVCDPATLMMAFARVARNRGTERPVSMV